MKTKAILFDFYNTLLNIRTDEHAPDVWLNLARFFSYQGLRTDAGALHDAFFARMRAMQQESGETWPEINMMRIFQSVLGDLGYRGPDQFCIQVAQLFRALSMRHFEPFSDTLPALQSLRERFKLGLISDAQRIFIEPEMEKAGLAGFFDAQIISSDYGFRKPDPRLFNMALEALGVAAEESVYIGDNAYRDVCGAQSAGLCSILVQRHEAFDEENRRNCRPDMILNTLDEILLRLAVA